MQMKVFRALFSATLVVAAFWACVTAMTLWKSGRLPAFSLREALLTLWLIAAGAAGDLWIRRRKET